MAMYWDPELEDEEELKKKGATVLYHIYRELKAGHDNASDEDKEAYRARLDHVRKAMMTRFHEEKIADVVVAEPYDLLSYFQIATDEDIKEQKTTDVKQFKKETFDAIQAQLDELGDRTDFVACLRRQALLKSQQKIVESTRGKANQAELFASVPDLQQEIADNVESIKTGLNDPDYDSAVEVDKAEKSGALEDVDANVMENYRLALAAMLGYDKVDGKEIKASDRILDSVIGDNIVPSDNFSIYEPIKNKYKITFTNGKDDLKAEQSAELQNQLLRNAGVRATYDLLGDKDFYEKFKSYSKNPTDEQKQQIKEAFQAKVEAHYKHSIVLASITTENAPELLEKVKYVPDKSGKYVEAVYDGNDEAIIDIATRLEQGQEMKLNMVTVAMDQFDLENRTKAVEQALKTKGIKDTALKFYNNIKEASKAGWKRLKDKDFWKKMLPKAVVNFVIFGGAGMAMGAGTALLFVPGAVAYGAWSYANAKIMPVYDAVMNKLRADENWRAKSWGERVASKFKVFGHGISGKFGGKEFKELWATTEKEVAERETRHSAFGKKWKRSNSRSAAGIITGGAALFGGFLGGPTIGKFVRQGVAAFGRAAILGESVFANRKAKQKLHAKRSIGNFAEYQTTKGQVVQDGISLGSTVIGSFLSHTLFDSETESKQSSAPENSASTDNSLDSVPSQRTSVQDTTTVAAPAQDTTTVAASAQDTTETSVQDTTTVAAPAPTTAPEAEDSGNASENTEAPKETVSENAQPAEPADDQAAYKDLLRRMKRDNWTKEHVDDMLARVKNGTISYNIGDKSYTVALPEGMTKYQAVEAFYYLSKWNAKLEGSVILGRLLSNDCDHNALANYTAEDVQKAVASLKAIDLTPDRTVTAMVKGCEVVRHTHGSLDVNKYNEIMGAEQKMVYTANRTVVTHGSCDGRLNATVIRGTVDCENNKIVTNVKDLGNFGSDGPDITVENEVEVTVETAENDTPAGPDVEDEREEAGAEQPAEPIEQRDCKIEAPDALFFARTVHQGSNHDIPVERESVEGTVHAFKFRNIQYISNAHPLEVKGSGGLLTDTQEVYAKNGLPMNLTKLVEKLPDKPTWCHEYSNRVVYLYESASGGTSWSVTVGAPNEEGISTMHVYWGDKEVIVNNATAKALVAKISQSGPLNGEYVADVGNSLDGINFTKSALNAQTKAEENAANSFVPQGESNGAAEEDVTASEPEVEIHQTTKQLTAEQYAEIVKADKITFIGVDEGRMKFAAGSINFSTSTFHHMNMDNATATASCDRQVYTVDIINGENQKLSVVISPAESNPQEQIMTIVDGKRVVLDEATGNKVKHLAEQAMLNDQKAKINIEVHDGFTKKLLQAVKSSGNAAAKVAAKSNGR